MLEEESFTFNQKEQKIKTNKQKFEYNGRVEKINILPRLLGKYKENKQFETHLQAYILQNLESLPVFSKLNIEWIGNEVSCGVGMQRIDIMLSIDSKNRKVIPIELKSICAYPDIIMQLQRYINWLEQYYIPNRPSDIEPMIISRKFTDKTSKNYLDLIALFKNFNKKNNILPLRYIEFEIDTDKEKIIFSEIFYQDL